ncbi:hypothetical protein NIES267_61400 [Calothrix parasitica NIES-267]|uniref:HicB-like antitoxin of toxin-antitoxin system domain-containing protein n=1 Tax=Calothrix parasitica NIES-267 TaxID=1973488 RepID=A0A1Z4LZG9_9CYAN|nr:hypothetical protein NIES267_61400 [Calothrix parasitica NIES-267]
MRTRSFTVIVYKEDDMYIAGCPEVGTVDQGETIEKAVAGLQEAYLQLSININLPASNLTYQGKARSLIQTHFSL